MTFNFCPSDLVKLFNNLVGANISVAPTAPPNISENISCVGFTLSPSSSALSILLPCSDIPVGTANPNVAFLLALFNLVETSSNSLRVFVSCVPP